MERKHSAGWMKVLVLTGMMLFPGSIPQAPAGAGEMCSYGEPDYHYRLGRHLQERGKHRLAAQEFRSALKARPDWADSFNALGLSLDAMEMRGDAVKAYKNALKRDPERADVLNNLGYSHLVRGNYGSAVYYINKAVTLDPDNRLYRNNLGAAYVKEGHFDAALEEFRMAAETPGEARMRLASVLLQNGHEREAREQMIMAGSLEDIELPAGPGQRPAEDPGAAGAEMTEGKDKPEAVDDIEDQPKGEK